MAADAGIFQQYLKPVRSVADYQGDMDKQEQNALTLAAARQSASDDNAVRQAYIGSGGDTNKIRQALLQGGNVKALNAYDKAQLDTQKTQGDIGLTKAKTAESAQKTDAGSYKMQVDKHDKAITDIAALQDPQTAHSSIDAHLAAGDIDPQKAQALHASIPQDPAQFPSWQVNMLRGILTAKDQLSQVSPDANARLTSQTSLANNAATNATSRANNASTVGATMRGQNLTDGRAREANGNAMMTPEYKQDMDGNWIALPKKVGAGGQITALPVFGSDGKPLAGNAKPLTEMQGKATTFAARMQDSEGVIDALEKQGVSGSDFRTMAAGSNYTNFAASPAGQQYRQAQENWVTANLRQESGAAIGKDEMDKDVRKFFPTVGDSAAVKAQKQTARSVATQGMLTQAGAGAKTIPGILSRAGSKSSSVAPAKTTSGATVSNW